MEDLWLQPHQTTRNKILAKTIYYLPAPNVYKHWGFFVLMDEQQKKYRKKNREKILEKKAEYRKKNQKKIKKFMEEYVRRPGVKKAKKKYDEAYLKRPEVKDRRRKYMRAYSKNRCYAPEEIIKRRARETLRRAVKLGKIAKPRRCSKCKAKNNIEGHHEDYSKPLEVEWLCMDCHDERHMSKGKTQMENQSTTKEVRNNMGNGIPIALAAAVSTGAMSSEHSESFYKEDEAEDTETFYGSLDVNLKNTKDVEEKVKGWFKKLFVGDKKWEEEVVDQTNYLKNIYDAFSSLGYNNVLYMDLNGETIYEDNENDENDFDKAIKLALEKDVSQNYNVAISLDTTGDEEENILITMKSKHDSGAYPLTVEVIDVKEPAEMLDKIKGALEYRFEIESTEVEADEAEEEVEEEEAATESTESTPESTTE
ncbi:hypothetical protein LCGC14_0442270 [marine sediment metagenome]|uniref:Uncharacterized protein n=1 Tax=marine sediment metagenome TaxID=412755 RepID=A0A0F9T3H6_9ZZZZ